MFRSVAWAVTALAVVALAGTASAGQRCVVVGIVKASAADAEEAATVTTREVKTGPAKAAPVVYKIVKDDKGQTVARNANNENVRIEGTLEVKNGVKWITVISCKIVE